VVASPIGWCGFQERRFVAMLFYIDPLYLLLMIVTLIISGAAQMFVKSATRSGAVCATP
jgi:hypothetical protein